MKYHGESYAVYVEEGTGPYRRLPWWRRAWSAAVRLVRIK